MFEVMNNSKNNNKEFTVCYRLTNDENEAYNKLMNSLDLNSINILKLAIKSLINEVSDLEEVELNVN
jgi:hypothetical protein